MLILQALTEVVARMKKLRFEFRITLAYLLAGGLWILFSDLLLAKVFSDPDTLTSLQTWKGWFFVAVTALFLFFFLRKRLRHLRETRQLLQVHRDRLNELVLEKTQKLDQAIEELSEKNEALNTTLENLKNMQTQLLQAEKMASLGVLTAGVAHEINNPLNYMLGGLTGLENFFDEEKIKTENTELFLTSIRTGIERVNAIVSGLNQMSRNKETYDEDCDLHEIIGNCLMILSNKLAHRVEVVENYPAEKIIVPGNVGQLHQVFINILMNSIQSINNTGRISIQTQLKKNKVKIAITDTGCGIAAEHLKKITDPFFTTKDPGEGTGLGLSITYNIVREHGGTLDFHSEQGSGTSVSIELPVKAREK